MFTGYTYLRVGDDTLDLGHNDTVILGESLVFAMFASGGATVPYQYLAISSGNSEDFVDSENPPSNAFMINKYFSVPGVKNKLFNEFFRVELDRSIFIDPEGNPTNIPQPVVELSWIIPNDKALGVWREIGLFAGDATLDSNSGTLVHYQTIKDINKTKTLFADEDITFCWRIDFSA